MWRLSEMAGTMSGVEWVGGWVRRVKGEVSATAGTTAWAAALAPIPHDCPVEARGVREQEGMARALLGCGHKHSSSTQATASKFHAVHNPYPELLALAPPPSLSKASPLLSNFEPSLTLEYISHPHPMTTPTPTPTPTPPPFPYLPPPNDRADREGG